MAHDRKDRGQPTGIRHRDVTAPSLSIKAPEFARHLTYGGQTAYPHFFSSRFEASVLGRRYLEMKKISHTGLLDVGDATRSNEMQERGHH